MGGVSATKRRKHSLETRLKISAAHKGKQFTLGRVMPDDEKKRRSEIFKGRIFTSEWKANISKAKKGIPPSPNATLAAAAARMGLPAHNRKSVIKLTLAGVEIERFSSIKLAAESIPTRMSTIQRALRGEYKKTQGFIWRFA